MRRPTASTFAFLALLPVFACVDPEDRRPGLRLGGEVVEEGPGDWSFTADHAEIAIETRTPWLIPHSVTILCAAQGGRFFVAARDPDEKRWVAHVDRDPNVRLKIGDRIYERRLVPLDDTVDRTLAYAAYAAKYGWPPTPAEDAAPLRFFEVLARR